MARLRMRRATPKFPDPMSRTGSYLSPSCIIGISIPTADPAAAAAGVLAIFPSPSPCTSYTTTSAAANPTNLPSRCLSLSSRCRSKRPPSFLPLLCFLSLSVPLALACFFFSFFFFLFFLEKKYIYLAFLKIMPRIVHCGKNVIRLLPPTPTHYPAHTY